MMSKSIREVLQNIGWLVFDKVFMLVMNMVVLFVVANYYGPERYGLYQYATSIVLILEIVVQLVDGRVVKKKYDGDNFDLIVFNVTIAKSMLSCAVLLIGTIIIAVSQKGTDFSFILIFLMIDSIVKNLRFGMENRFEYFLKSRKVVIAANAGLLAGTIFQIVAVCNDFPIQYLAAIQLIATSISLAVLYIQYIKEYNKRKRSAFNKEIIWSIISESFPLAIAAAANVIYTRCDSVMLGMLLTTTEVGIYSISAKLVSTIQILIAPIQTSIFVRMIDWYNDPKKYEINYLRITSITTWIAISGILLSFVILPCVFKLLKPDYLPALNTYKILSISTVFTYNAILRSSHFTITKNGRILMIAQLVTVVINIVLNYILIRSVGMNGAAIATVISQFISLFVSNLFFKEARFVFRSQVKGFNPMYILK